MRLFLISILLFSGAFLDAQGPPPNGHDHPPPRPDWGGDPHQGPPRRSLLSVPPGKWWWDPGLVRALDLTSDQQKRIDDIYQQNRDRLIALSAALQKEQSAFEPLLNTDQLDQTRAAAQIDRIAQARADLEKTNARMLLSFRGVLSREQWKRLQAPNWRPPPGDAPR